LFILNKSVKTEIEKAKEKKLTKTEKNQEKNRRENEETKPAM
jgi:hypothetical protein